MNIFQQSTSPIDVLNEMRGVIFPHQELKKKVGNISRTDRFADDVYLSKTKKKNQHEIQTKSNGKILGTD